ncbi:MAG: hypothetical protein LUF26_07795 [Firmicutes bacterium]|nr:hypothetical protein [Bacillota bacterium]
MKRKFISVLLAAVMTAGTTVFAQTLTAVDNGSALVFEREGDTIAVLSCYDDDGVLCYSNKYKSEDGEFALEIPEQYEDMRKRVYFVDTNEFIDIEAEDDDTADEPAATETPEATETPSATDEPDATEEPATTSSKYPSIYEKALDAIYAPALVTDVETSVDSNDEEIYAVTVFYQGEEMKVGIETDLEISTAPDAYSFAVGEDAGALEPGDVVSMTANLAGTRINRLDLLFRPTSENLATDSADYGTDFEELFTSGGKVASQWSYIKFGEKASSDRYQYAFGIIAMKSGSTLTLINKEASEDETIEVDFQSDTMVYSCDVSGKEYDFEIVDTNSIETTLSESEFKKNGSIELTDDYSYNYAFVRIVDGTATDIILYNNYNE